MKISERCFGFNALPALVCFLAIFVSAVCSAQEVPEKEGGKKFVETTSAGDSLEIVSFDPPVPGKFPVGTKVKIKFKYTLKSAGLAFIHARPYEKSVSCPGFVGSGSPEYPAGTGEGEYELSLMGEGKADEIQLEVHKASLWSLLKHRIFGSETLILTLYAKVGIEWVK